MRWDCLRRNERHRRDLLAFADPYLSDELAARSLSLQHDRVLGGRQHLADCSQNATRLLNPGHEVSGGARHGGDQQVAEGVARELAAGEAILESLGERGRLGQQRSDATPEITRGGNAEKLSQPAARAAVVGDRDHRRELGRVLPSCLECLGEPMTAPDRDHFRGDDGPPFAQRSMSRWWTTGV